ncbi:MAG: 16S rRNA processing protein RimM [Thermoflexales bacterium]|nr:16S rRNA processing protein RimM [Thermoflexales bacterium]
MKQNRGSGGPPPEPNFLIVGRVLRAWGIRGDLKIQPMTDRPADFARLTQVYVGVPPRRYEVQSFRPYQGNWLLHLMEVSTRTQAEALHDQPILIERVQRKLEADEYLADQIIGLKVITLAGEALGTVAEILTTGANDVYVVQGERGEVLLPARSEVVRSIDLASATMTVELLPGL